MALESVKDKVTVTVTKEGAALKHNSWKEGDTIQCSKALAEKFTAAGFVTMGGAAKSSKKEKS